MLWQHSPYTLPHLLVAALSAALGLYAWFRRGTPGASTFALMMGALAWWSAAAGLQHAGADLATQTLWSNLSYLGIVTTPPTWFALALQYTGRLRHARARHVALLALLPVLSNVAVWSNDWHHLFAASVRLVPQGSFVVTETTWGPLFWAHTAYCYAFLVAGTVLLLHGLVRAPVVYRGQARALLFAVFVPWAVNVAYDVGMRPWPHLDPTPFAFAVSAASFAWGLFRFGLLDLVPVARAVVVEGMADGVVVLDDQGRILDLNPAARAIVGPKAIESIGRLAAAVLQGWPDLEALPLGVIREMELGARSYELVASELTPRDGPRASERSGRARGRLVVARDVTERKRAERTLAEALRAEQELNLLKTRFMIVTSHEMRTPLTVLRGYAEALLGGYVGQPTPPQAQALEVCRRTLDRMIASFDDIIEMLRLGARGVPLRRRPTDVTALALEVVAELRPFLEKRRQSVEVNGDAGQGRVDADPEKLRLALANLVQNAIRFTPDAGRIRVEVQPEAGGIHLVVADDGIGIEADELPRLFEAFYTTDPQHHRSGDYEFETRGNGLGLAIARAHVEAQGGRIWAESEGRGRGSRFHVVLPGAGPRV